MARASLKQLQAVHDALEVVYQNAMSAAQSDQQHAAQLKKQLEDLNASGRVNHQALAEAASPALHAGADVLWRQWVEKRKAALNTELARAMVKVEISRATLGRALGRKEAVNRLMRQACDEIKQTKQRRTDYL